MKRKVSISTGVMQLYYSDKECLDIAKRIGADAVDFGLDKYSKADPECIYSKSDEEIIAYYTELKKYADEIGIEFAQTHGRLFGFKNIKEDDDLLIEDGRIDFLVTRTLGADICVVHSVTTIVMGPDAERKLMHDLNFDMFTRLLHYAKQYDVIVASETFGDAVAYDCCDFFGNINEFLISYNKVAAIGDNEKYFKTCVDTGHSNKAMRFGNPTAGDVIRMLGKSVVALHLNDNDTFTDQHKTPMTGTIDWDDVFNALDEIGYDGIYNLELELRHFGEDFIVEEAEFSVKVLRHLLNKRYGKE